MPQAPAAIVKIPAKSPQPAPGKAAKPPGEGEEGRGEGRRVLSNGAATRRARRQRPGRLGISLDFPDALLQPKQSCP
jgi:hypothetical protein